MAKERGYSCHKCYASITVVGPDSQIDQALRRVDWKREGGVVTCRRCVPLFADAGKPVPYPGGVAR